jgi:hypothetical protein
MLGVRKAKGDVRKFSNGKKRLVDAGLRGVFCYCYNVISKKERAALFHFCRCVKVALAEKLVFPYSLENHANIITKQLFPLKSRTYAL